MYLRRLIFFAMNILPVSSSTLSANALIPVLRTAYGFSDQLSCRIIRAGVNHTYLVTGNTEHYVFRIYSHGWRTIKEIEEELRFIFHLKEQQVPVSYPVADREGRMIRELQAPEGLRYGVLFSYARGEKMLSMDDDAHFRIGTIMAQLHRQASGFAIERVTYTPQVLLQEPLPLLNGFLPDGIPEMAFMERCSAYLFDVLSAADTSQLRSGTVHLDIWFDNLNMDQDGNVTLFDFDFCGNGWLCLDVAYYLMQLYFLEPDTQLQKRNHFLEGYESVTPLTAEEKRLLPFLGSSLYFFYLGVQCRRFEDWSNVFLSETYLKRYIQVRVKRFFDYSVPGNDITL